MMKMWMATVAAAGFLGIMSPAQAGMPGEPVTKAATPNMAAANEKSAAPTRARQGQSSQDGQQTSKPTVPGADQAQSSALSNGQQMAIAGGALLVGGIIAAASGGGSDESSTPGTGGTTGSTGTTGTH